MKHFVGPSLLALMIATGSSIATAQNSGSDTSAQPPAAATEGPAEKSAMPAGSAADAKSSDEMKSPTAATTAKAPADEATKKTYTVAEGKEMVGKRIYSLNGDDMGEISGIEEGTDGNVAFFHADIGGFLGLGETRVKVEPSKFSLADDKLTLPMTAKEAKTLPRVES